MLGPSTAAGAFQPIAAQAASSFLSHGLHFAGTSEVTVTAVSTRFKVLTANFIRVAVPAGASTGKLLSRMRADLDEHREPHRAIRQARPGAVRGCVLNLKTGSCEEIDFQPPILADGKIRA